jgi:hypothetical protein
MTVEPGGEERGQKTESLLCKKRKEGCRPCPVTLTVPSHEMQGRDARPIGTAETHGPIKSQKGRGKQKTKGIYKITRKGKAAEFLQVLTLDYNNAIEDRWKWQMTWEALNQILNALVQDFMSQLILSGEEY